MKHVTTWVLCALSTLILGCTTTSTPQVVYVPEPQPVRSSGTISVPQPIKDAGRVAGKIWDATLGWIEYGTDAALSKLEEVKQKDEEEKQ